MFICVCMLKGCSPHFSIRWFRVFYFKEEAKEDIYPISSNFDEEEYNI